MVLGLQSLLGGITGLMQGFGFGAGYGSGVRFGYQDLYPTLKSLIGGTHGSFFGSGLKGGLGLDITDAFGAPASNKTPAPVTVDTSGLGLVVGSDEYNQHRADYMRYSYANPF